VPDAIADTLSHRLSHTSPSFDKPRGSDYYRLSL